MNTKQILFVVIISALVGGIFTLGQSIIFGGGTMYLYDDDYKNINEMNYSDAQEYLAKRTKEITGFESFKNGIKYSQFWGLFIQIWIYYTVMGFLCCVIYVFVNNYLKTKSNNQLQATQKPRA